MTAQDITSDDSKNLVYVEVNQVLDLYALALGHSEEYARAELLTRDGLESSLGRPQQQPFYEDADRAQQAAVLAHGICEGHHFRDGNKRLAATVMESFLHANGYHAAITPEERYQWIVALSGPENVNIKLNRLAAAIRLTLRLAHLQ